jgi:hypothetical protein
VNILEFLTYYSAFFLFAVWLFGQMGQTVFTGIPAPPTAICTLDVSWTVIFQLIICGVSDFVYFFSLLFISSPFQPVIVALVTPYAIGMMWVIAAWLRGVGIFG